MNNYQIAPSQLQIWSDAKNQLGQWKKIDFQLPENCTPNEACERLINLSELLELLYIRLVKIQSLSIPVQQIEDEPSTEKLQINTIVVTDGDDLESILKKEKEAINSGDAIISLIIEGDNAVLLSNKSHFDNKSVQLLVEMIIAPPADYEDAQFLDFSEWLNEGFAESPQDHLAFWSERHAIASPELVTISTEKTEMATRTLSFAYQKESNWEDTVLVAWLKALFTRLNLPNLLRFDRILSYRNLGELDSVIGPLEVRVPMQIDFSKDSPIEQLKDERKKAEEYLTSFDLKAARESSANIVFEVVDAAVESKLVSGSLNLQASITKDDQLQLSFHYDQNIITNEFAEIILEATSLTLQHKEQLGAKELAWLEQFGTGGTHPKSEDPIETLKKVVIDEPDATAVIAKGISWTRAKLWERITEISQTLQSQGIRAGHKVGFLLLKEHDAIASIFGILHAGATYVPMDPEWPTLRIQQLCEDASISFMITNQSHQQHHNFKGINLLLLDDLSVIRQHELEKPSDKDDAELGYILYTSGSTGKPKGACIPRIAMSHLANAFATDIHANQALNRKVFAVNAPLFFDGSVKQVVMLLHGVQLYLIDENTRRNPVLLLESLKKDKVDCFDCTPTHLRLLLEVNYNRQILMPPTVLIGGEKIDDHLWKQLAAIKTTDFINVYGPTEATVVTTWSPVKHELVPGIGKPLPGSKVWVRDENGARCSIGTVGELWIGGEKVAKGYLGKPDLTAKSFITTPDGQGNIYRSGDRVTWLKDGRLAFIGRIDNQVKLRGHRVELGEIEAVITEHPAVHNAAVIPQKTSAGETQITAFAEVKTSSITRENILPNGNKLSERTHVETDYLFKEIFVDQVYAAHNVILPENAFIFDVGANIGMFSIWAKYRWPSASIHAFEPVPDVAKVCDENISVLDKVKLHRYGLSDSVGELEFVHYHNYSMMSGIVEGANSDSEREIIRQQLENRVKQGDTKSIELLDNLDKLLEGRFESELIHIPVSTLHDEFQRLAVNEIHLLKIDVQRSELNVLRGLSDDDFDKVKQIVMEVHDAHGTPSQGRVDTIMDLLEDHGFEVRVDQDDDLKGTDRFSLVAWKPEWRNEVKDSYIQKDTCSVDDLYDWIAKRLPDYLLPNHIKILQTFPLTASGKINRKELEGLTQISRNDTAGDKPSNDIERRLIKVWSKILNIENISVTDNFFRLGGDSISGIRLQIAAREAGLHFELRHLFEHQTIRKIATHTTVTEQKVDNQELAPFSLITNEARAHLPSGLDDAYPMSGLQLGMVFHTEYVNDPKTYHNITIKRLRANFSQKAFDHAWQNCINEHEILRVGFNFSIGDKALQLVHSSVIGTVEYHDWSTLNTVEIKEKTDAMIANELSTPFDLAKPPLLRLRLCNLPNDEILIAIAEHHAILDGLSLELLREELLERYQIALKEETQPKHNLSCRPAHFIKKEQEAIQIDLEPWREVLESATPIRIGYGQSLPTNADRGFEQNKIKVDTKLKNALEKRAENLDVQLKHILLSIHARTLGEWTGNNDVLTGLVVHGRPELRDSERMLGLFINTLPFRLQVNQKNWNDLIKATRDQEQWLQNYRHTPLWVLKREFAAAVDIPTFFNYVAFNSQEATFEELEERHIGVDVDVDLAVDFSIENGELYILHQYPKATADAVQSSDLLELTLKVLKAASDENNLDLNTIEPSEKKQEKPEEFKYQSKNIEVSEKNIHLVTSVVAEVLDIESVSADASFRELGGHSLKAVEVIYKLRESSSSSSPLMKALTEGSLTDVAMQLELNEKYKYECKF
jgi:amino acid adenylation domain-containing protein/FkbM family methyltransferase